jgi:hypothetical protein
MNNFLASLIVSMVDVVGIFGYIISALIARKYWVAVALGITWRISIGTVLGMHNNIPAILAALIVTSIVYYVKCVFTNRRRSADEGRIDETVSIKEGAEVERPLSALDVAQKEASYLIVNRYRELAENQGLSFSSSAKMSDRRLLDIYEKITRRFKDVARQRGEELSATRTNYIALYFMQIDEEKGGEFFNEHLDYELDKFLREGLRETYKHDLSIAPGVNFDAEYETREADQRNRTDNYWAALDIIQSCIQKLDIEDQFRKIDMYLPEENVIDRLDRLSGSTAYDMALMLIDAGYEKSERLNRDDSIENVVQALRQTGAIVSTQMIQSFRDAFLKTLTCHDEVLTKVSEVAILNGSKIIPQNGSIGSRMKDAIPQKYRTTL